MKAYIEPYDPQMRDEVVSLRLRLEDEQEVWNSHRMTPKEAIESSLDASTKTWVIYYDENIIAVFGVSIIKNTTIALPWLLGSPELHKIKYRIIKYGGLVVRDMFFFDDIELLTNYVSSNHTEAIKWLKWLGFTLHDEAIYFNDVEFKQFSKWRST